MIAIHYVVPASLMQILHRLFVDIIDGAANPKSKNHWLDINPPQFQSNYQLLVLVLLLCHLVQVPSVRGVASLYQPYRSALKPSRDIGPALAVRGLLCAKEGKLLIPGSQLG